MCRDLVENLCSEQKLRDLVLTIGDTKTLSKVSSWLGTAIASLRKLKRDYAAFPDVVLPFTAGLAQVWMKCIYIPVCSTNQVMCEHRC